MADLINVRNVVEAFDLNTLDLRHRDVRVEQTLHNQKRHDAVTVRATVMDTVSVTVTSSVMVVVPVLVVTVVAVDRDDWGDGCGGG